MHKPPPSARAPNPTPKRQAADLRGGASPSGAVSQTAIWNGHEHKRAHNIDVLTVGQYLRPTKSHAEVVRYYKPDEFVRLKGLALEMGFGHVEAGPLVRSSYHADEQVPERKSLLAG
jgi:hypothetical protein